MLTLFKSYFRIINLLIRLIYWQYRWLNNAKTGGGGIISFPLKFEGSGKLIIGNSYRIGRHVFMGIGDKGFFKTKNGLQIGNNVELRIGNESNLTAGDNLSIENGVKICVNDEWEWGNGVSLCANCQLSSRESGYFGKLIIGNGSEIGDNTIVDVSADVIIGNDVSVGPNCILYSHNHLYNDKTKAAWKGGVDTASIIIQDGAWIASGVTILPGVTIGKRTVVAAGAVVTKNLESESVYGGIPAILIKRI